MKKVNTAKTAKKAPTSKARTLSPEIELLIKSVKSSPKTLRTLCDDVFKSSPKHVEGIVAQARKLGYTIDILDGELDFKPVEQTNGVRKIPVKVTSEKQFAIGVISDVHFGSKYCIPEAVIEHIEYCYSLGIRDIFCPGDLLEGCYKHARFELTHVGWEDQAQEALRHLPQKEGLKYYFIDGNHDFTFTDEIGLESGKSLVRLAKELGRNDITFLGSRGALINYAGTRIELWHPKKGGGYALSYGLQNHVRDTEPEERPHMLFTGHWHQFCQIHQGGVYAVACGTFQHGKGPFGKSLGGSTAIGGLVVRWSLADGKVKNFSAEHRKIHYVEPDYNIV